MAIVSGLLALAMVAADGPSCPPVETTTYQVRVLTLDGLDWRTSSYARLQPVVRQGTSTVWTADRALAASLADRASSSSPCNTIMAVGEAVMTKADTVNYIAAMDRVADGPINQSSAIAFMPRPERVEERFAIKVSGRKLDQGILTKITLEETHVDVIHGVPQSETLVPAAKKSTRTTVATSGDLANNNGVSPSPAKTSITSSVQIPEVTQARVEGEWLIPNDGVLLVSLGVKTAADDKGMAVVRERVAVIEACSGTSDPEANRATVQASQLAPFQHTKLAQPVVPGRSLPEPMDPNGNLIDLPPLPEALASADLDRIKPEPYQPSPQSPVLSAPSADSALARTGFDAAPAAPKSPVPIMLTDAEARAVLPSEVFEALARAGVGVELDFDVKEGLKPKRPTEADEVEGADIDIVDVIKALLKAGVKINKVANPAKATCEKCDGDLTFCPANARSLKPGVVAGSIKLVPDVSPQDDGVTTQEALSTQIHDFAAYLDAADDKDEALKMLGQTKTTVVPLDGRVSLELKATIVPTSPEKAKAATRKVEVPATRR